jgi:hypothetical protein
MIEILLFVFLFFSVIANLFLAWYCRKLIQFVKLTTSDVDSLQESIDSYKEHLTKVYGLETFYGDQTLKSLLEHTRDLSGDVEDFIQVNTSMLYGEDDG